VVAPAGLEGPHELRRQHTPFARDMLTAPSTPPVARHRARMILTPIAVREAIIEDAAAKPEPVRLRSLRRRLTPLDRALSGIEAAMLERLTSCLDGLANIGCADPLKSEIRDSPVGRLPFSEHKRLEIWAMTYVMKQLTPAQRSTVLDLAALLNPSSSLRDYKPGEVFVASVCSAAAAVVIHYAEWSRQAEGCSKKIHRN
jgi:hypothetical protein